MGLREHLEGEQRRRETADMSKFVMRVVRAIGRRADEGDMESVEALAHIQVVVHDELGRAARVLQAEPWGYSWADIGRALGVTRQAAQQRFGTTGP